MRRPLRGSTSHGWLTAAVRGLSTLLLALACAARPTIHHPERVRLAEHACSDLASCLEVLERSSELPAQAHAEEQLAGFGAAAIPRLAWLAEQGDDVSRYRASGALGRIAATRRAEVLAAARAVLHGRCSDSGWSACWALVQAQDHSAYPILAQHLKDGVDITSLFDGRPLPAAAAEWFLVELEDRNASAAVHGGVMDMLLRAEGPLSGASLERLRKLLRAELPPDLGHVPAGYPCVTSSGQCWALVDQIGELQQCPESFSRCWPRVNYLVNALGAWGPRGLAARDEVAALWQALPAPHQLIAREALARMGDRGIIPTLLRELSPVDRYALEHLALLGEHARPELPQLIALFEKAPGSERAALLDTILAIGGPLAIKIGMAALHESGDDDVTALKGLLNASKDTAAHASLRKEKATLEHLAAHSPFPQVRLLASELLGTLGFAPLEEPRPPACPQVVVTQIESRAQLASGTVTFKPLGNPARNSQECARGDIAAIRVGSECLHGHSFGEFGYKITAHDVGSAQPRDTVRGVSLNPVEFLRYGKHVLIIEGLAHGMARGAIDKLVRDGDGRWVAHRFSILPGVPTAYAFDSERRLLLLVQGSHGDFCQGENGGWQVVRIASDGALEALR